MERSDDQALADAFRATGNQRWLDAALKAARFILNELSNNGSVSFNRIRKN
ncbi:MAG: hypothetical protein IPF68_03675 [Bacteroidales bacterium]|nr:hypothetical protein [Bacteroidales bacterium]